MAVGPCEVWDIDDDCCVMPDVATDELIAKWQAVSSKLLFDGSGRRWGFCEITVRPCLRRCGGGISTGFPFWPYKGDDGAWRNLVSCACVGDCSCSELCEIVLEGPVSEIVEVVDGVDVIPADTYRVDVINGEYRLVRTSDDCWPSCQDIKASCGEEGAFCVTYMKGIALDELAIAANSELTCQLVRACIPGCKCDLPKSVQSVVRRGVAITFDTSRTWIRSLSMVAAFLDSANPNNLMSGSTVWSPDIPESRVTVTTEGS